MVRRFILLWLFKGNIGIDSSEEFRIHFKANQGNLYIMSLYEN